MHYIKKIETYKNRVNDGKSFEILLKVLETEIEQKALDFRTG